MSVNSDDRTLFIGNLDKKVSDDVLYELFLQAGPIERVNIVTNNSTSNQFGFVTYKHEMSIDYALQLYKGTYLFNKELAIKKRGKNNNVGQLNEVGRGIIEPLRSHATYNLDQVHNGEQNFRPGSSIELPAVFNFKGNGKEGSWSGRNKTYDHRSRSYASRADEQRRMYKGRPPVGKTYHHNRKKRY